MFGDYSQTVMGMCSQFSADANSYSQPQSPLRRLSSIYTNISVMCYSEVSQ